MAAIREQIALCGPTGAGKTTVASFLSEHHDYSIISTGLVVRDVSRLIYGHDSDKSLLNILADSLVSINPTLVLEAAIRRTKMCANLVVFDAIRTNADLEYIRSANFFIIRVDAPLEVRMNRLNHRGQSYAPTSDEFHSLEMFYRSVKSDASIDNSGDMASLFQSITLILDQ